MERKSSTVRYDRYLVTVSIFSTPAVAPGVANTAAHVVVGWVADWERHWKLTEWRAVYFDALNGKSDADPDETDYGRLIAEAAKIAAVAAEAPTDASVLVDIEED